MKMNTPEMTIKREQTLNLYTEDFEAAAENLYCDHEIDDFNADDICEAVIERVTAADVDTHDWVESLSDENKRAIVITMQNYLEKYILDILHNNFDYIMNQNGWEKERE